VSNPIYLSICLFFNFQFFICVVHIRPDLRPVCGDFIPLTFNPSIHNSLQCEIWVGLLSLSPLMKANLELSCAICHVNSMQIANYLLLRLEVLSDRCKVVQRKMSKSFIIQLLAFLAEKKNKKLKLIF
jgi:hypothetical protein